MNTEQELAYWRERTAFEEWFTKTKAYISDPKHIMAQVVKDIAWEAWQARSALQSQDQEDAERYRWLTEDHADAETRTRCREILDRMAVMSYSSACDAIDHARRIEGDGE